MADTKTETHAPKTDAHAKVDAPASAATAPAAPKAVEKAADAAVKAAEKAAPAPLKEAAKASAKAATAPARAAAQAATRSATKAAPARRTAKRATAKAATARNTAATARKAQAPKRAAAPARAARAATTATAANTTTTNTIINAKSINEGTRNMKNEAKQAADRFQVVFGDVNERAKGAFERNARIAEEMTELTKGNVEALVASTKVAAKGVETLGQEVAEFSRKSFEDASAALKGFADVKSPTDFFRLQGDFARSQFDMMVAESAKMSETMLKLAGQAAEPITGRYTAAVEKVRTAVVA